MKTATEKMKKTKIFEKKTGRPRSKSIFIEPKFNDKSIYNIENKRAQWCSFCNVTKKKYLLEVFSVTFSNLICKTKIETKARK